MTYLVVSDLHGSTHGLELLKRAIFAQKPDALIVLGDILFGAYDGDEGQVCAFFASLTLPVLAVRGNCDYAFDAKRLGFDLPETRSFRFAGRTFYLQHRPWCRGFDGGEVALSGHTHVKCLYREGEATFLNPGSLGKPRDDGPGYATIDESGITLFDAETLTSLKRILF